MLMVMRRWLRRYRKSMLPQSSVAGCRINSNDAGDNDRRRTMRMPPTTKREYIHVPPAAGQIVGHRVIFSKVVAD